MEILVRKGSISSHTVQHTVKVVPRAPAGTLAGIPKVGQWTPKYSRGIWGPVPLILFNKR